MNTRTDVTWKIVQGDTAPIMTPTELQITDGETIRVGNVITTTLDVTTDLMFADQNRLNQTLRHEGGHALLLGVPYPRRFWNQKELDAVRSEHERFADLFEKGLAKEACK